MLIAALLRACAHDEGAVGSVVRNMGHDFNSESRPFETQIATSQTAYTVWKSDEVDSGKQVASYEAGNHSDLVANFQEAHGETGMSASLKDNPEGLAREAPSRNFGPAQEVAREFLSNQSAVGDLNTPIGRLQVVSMLPSDDGQYALMYRETPSASTSNYVRRTNEAFDHIGASHTRWPSGQSLDKGLHAFSHSSDTVMILAHSRDNIGHEIVLPDGSTRSYGEIQSACASVKLICIVVTCNSQDVSSIREIELTQLVQVADISSISVANDKNKTVGHLIRELNITARAQHIHGYAVASVGVAGLGGGLVGVTYQMNSGSDKKRSTG